MKVLDALCDKMSSALSIILHPVGSSILHAGVLSIS